MSPTNDHDPAGGDDRMSAEIERTMAEAEAAVSAMGHEGDDDGSDEETVDFDAILAAKDDEIAALKDKWLRAVADQENYKKRVKRDTDDAITRKTQSLLTSFLPTIDNLDRALEIAEPVVGQVPREVAGNVEQVVRGLRMVRDEFLTGLKKHGIEPVPSVGVPFDPAIHDALQQIDTPDHAPGVVIREFEKGYKLGDRLIRPARVIIAGSGSGAGAGSDGAAS
jgi:molecular chaperone GrpE